MPPIPTELLGGSGFPRYTVACCNPSRKKKYRTTNIEVVEMISFQYPLFKMEILKSIKFSTFFICTSAHLHICTLSLPHVRKFHQFFQSARTGRPVSTCKTCWQSTFSFWRRPTRKRNKNNSRS